MSKISEFLGKPLVHFWYEKGTETGEGLYKSSRTLKWDFRINRGEALAIAAFVFIIVNFANS